ncbi:MAG: PadR family transcriptional regulator [Gemmatimonadetes bacterium]|nr:PadR family transcriptional regulator [Gemmatimonadota bacterium]
MGPRARGFGWGAWARGGPGGWGAGCGPGFQWRFFDRGDLKYVILRLLKEKPMHGYEVMRALEEESGGWYRASAGSVYPTLQMLEDQGYVVAKEEEGKKVYSITDAGREYLHENRDVVENIFDRVSEFTSRFFRAGMGEVTRSFSRLAQATFERAVKWPGDEDVIRQLREILDRATHDVEGVRPQARSDTV